MTEVSVIPESRKTIMALEREVLEELIIQASTSFETDHIKAKRCLQRAADLVRDAREGRSDSTTRESLRGGRLAPWQIKKVTAYIEANINSRILAAQLSSVVGFSTGHFHRAFKLSFGQAPHAYVMLQRVARAKVLVATSGDPLAQIAAECGLCDQSHLTRIFRRYIGITPTAWRRMTSAGPVIAGPTEHYEGNESRVLERR